jgi:hypothetical protein
MTIGPLYFAAPTALLALLALPALFWLLRATPPAPRRTAFPPLRLLIGLRTDDEARRRAPLWLVILRAAMAALAILGFARPSLAPDSQARPETAAAAGPALIVIDDGWTSAPFWPAMMSAAERAVAQAERAGQSVAIAPTTPGREPPGAVDVMSPAEARGLLGRMVPQSWRPDRAVAAARLDATEGRFGAVLWLSDGLSDAGAEALIAAMRAKGPVSVELPTQTTHAIIDADATPEGLVVELRRAPSAQSSGAVAAETIEGRALGAVEYRFAGTSTTARAIVDLPPEIAARTARVRLVAERGAGGVRLLAGGAGRPFVGLVAASAQNQPLLSELFYVERAIQPFAATRTADLAALIDQDVQALVLPDASRLAQSEREALMRWLEAGGLLVRFAGPRLANDADGPLPMALRPGSRSIGGALDWEAPQQLQDFTQDSPFFGLAAPEDVSVRRQVLVEPLTEDAARVWARLQDGTPIVTAAAVGQGLVVLFHVTAGPDWSDLPFSGVYVEMLRRTLAFAGRAASGGGVIEGDGPFALERLLDGYGALQPPPSDVTPVPATDFATARAGPFSPPGLYAREGGPMSAIDAVAADETFEALSLPAGITVKRFTRARTEALDSYFLAAAMALIAADLMLALGLAGRLPRALLTSAAALALVWIVTPPPARAQAAADAATDMYLAYIVTGDARSDRIAQTGLEVLADTLRGRTAAEPVGVIGVDPAEDDLSPYPILYWRAPDRPAPLPERAVINLDRYMRLGGMVFVDTRDVRATGAGTAAATLLDGIDAPPLELVGAEHVLTKSFYLLSSFPGAVVSPQLYSETGAAAAARDGVASLYVGNGDWAAAWANATATRDPRQREMALRFGVNLVMVALTGNYKTDQVHLPALLDRLGEKSAPR